VTGSVLQLDRMTLRAGTVAVLRDISFTVAKGQTLGLVGESGAGKSMIGRLISGLLPPGFSVAQGKVLFEGVDITHQARQRMLGRRIAFIPQEPLSALNPLLRIGQQFGEHLARLGVSARARDRRAAEWLDSVHLPEPASLLKRYPHELSGGQSQRVLIAMAVSSRPALIVADEPTTALDVVTQARIMQLLKEQQAVHGAAILLITHDLHLAAAVCDEVGVMYAGDMVEKGPADAVLRDPKHPYSRALRNSTPLLRGPLRPLPSLPDQMPGLAAMAGLLGCRFAPRCPVRDASCADTVPEWHSVAPGHLVRCSSACQDVKFVPDAVSSSRTERKREGAILELDDVCLSYTVAGGWFRRSRVVNAVRNVSLRVAQGEFVGLVGESGSGKSSVARLVMGLVRPASGRITLQTEGRVQFVFQDPQSALNPRRTVLSLVTQALEAAGTPTAQRLLRARALLQETGLPADCLHRVPSQLSGGQRQRVNIARALCVTPRLLVADEIISGLDVSVQAQILNLLLALGRELDIGLLFISHDLAAVRYLCTRVAVMQHGQIVESGETHEVFANPRHNYTRRLLDAVPSNWRDRFPKSAKLI
jgi:peptide/nickel transport system ATP-binding protein